MGGKRERSETWESQRVEKGERELGKGARGIEPAAKMKTRE